MPPVAERAAAPVPAAGLRPLSDDLRRVAAAWARDGCGAACVPLVLSLVVVLFAIAAEPALHATAGPVTAGAVRLVLPRGYILGAPLFDVLDAMTRLSIRQHAALLLTVAVAFAGWRARLAVRRRRCSAQCRRPGQWLVTISAELRAAALAFGAVAAVYAAGAFLPRPLPRLAVDRSAHRELLVVDFHSHTNHSWDGRPGFTIERNRAWHEATGFDAAYVTDHDRVTPVDLPPERLARSEEGAEAWGPAPGHTLLLPGVELRYAGQHVILLGAEPEDSVAFLHGNLHPARLARLRAVRTGDPRTPPVRSSFGAANLRGATAPRNGDPPLRADGDAPVMLLTMPGDPGFARSHRDVLGIEVFDATPRALGGSPAAARRLAILTDSLGIARVAASNNHGLEHAAGAWNLMRIPGWRAMTVAELDRAIRTALRASGALAVTVIERRRVTAGGLAATVITAPALLVEVLRTLTWGERLSWLGWTWLVWGAWVLLRTRGDLAWSAP